MRYDRFLNPFAKRSEFMSRTPWFASLSACLAISTILVGCSGRQPGQQNSASPKAPNDRPPAATSHTDQKAQQKDVSDHAEHEAGAPDKTHEDALAELSPQDRVLAGKQQVCPVSGQPLGSMGKPYKVTVQGRDVLLCCPGCEAEIKADPEKYLAKLPK
jgi:membrane-bound lytic murein transglycosylase B